MKTALSCLLAVSAFGQDFIVRHRTAAPWSATQVQKKTYASTASATAHTITWDAQPTQNNLLVLTIVSNGTVSSVTGWTQAANAVDFTGTYIYYKIAGASETTTITINESSNPAVACALEYSGLVSSSPLDNTATATAQGGASTISTGTTATTTATNELLVAVVGISSGVGDRVVNSWSNSFAEQYQAISTNSSNIRNSTSVRSVTATGAYTTTATLASTTSHASGIIATFKAP